ncbi:hypothetical protein FRC12_022867 [Ceratobasidium sp. 428]|nr:hypothetical protein FRC12_022867 [Ceratobasidium sp. 428]
MPSKRKADADSDAEASAPEETEVLVKEPSPSSRIVVPVPEKQTDAEGNAYFEISGKRRVTVRSYAGVKLVDIREMYSDKATGELKPGKKGIALAEEQFMGLINAHGAITEALNELSTEASGSSGKKSAKITKAKVATKAEASKPAAAKPESKKKKKARKVASDDDEDE